MSKENVKNLVGHIVNGDLDNAKDAFKIIFDEKYRSALEAKKIAVASRVFNTKQESQK